MGGRWLAAALVGVLACGGASGGRKTEGSRDSGAVDSGSEDAGSLPDAGLDAGTRPDAGPDGGAGSPERDGGTMACSGPADPPLSGCSALPPLGVPVTRRPSVGGAQCATRWTSGPPFVTQSHLFPSTGDGQIVLETPWTNDPAQSPEAALLISRADGSVGLACCARPDYPAQLWPTADNWLRGGFGLNPIGPVSAFEIDWFDTDSVPTVFTGNTPAVFVPPPPEDSPLTNLVAKGGMFAVATDLGHPCAGTTAELPIQADATWVDASGTKHTAQGFACVNVGTRFLAAVSGKNDALVFLDQNQDKSVELFWLSPESEPRLLRLWHEPAGGGREDVTLGPDLRQIVALADGRFALADSSGWIGVVDRDGRVVPPPCWLVPRLGQSLQLLPSATGYWRPATTDLPLPDGGVFPCTTQVEEIAADGSACRTYDVGTASDGTCSSRPLVRGVDGTVAQLSPTCEILTWPAVRP